MIARALAVLAGTACGLLLVVIVPACSEEDIVLANLPPQRDSGGGMGGPMRCVEDKDCASDEFCSRTNCPDIGGTCATRPTVCENDFEPVCGCDGITYWNDCLRRTSGVTAGSMGDCQMGAHRCSFELKGSSGPPVIEVCPTGSACSLLLFDPQMQCVSEVHGKCWALPAVCPADEGPDRWIACGPSSACVKTCDAIRANEPHQRAQTCP